MKAVVAAVAVLAFASFAGAATTGHIVFAATDAPSNGDVMLVRANGTTLDLSASPALDSSPVLSPNGKLVAFFSMRGGHGAEWVVGIDGKGLRQVTPHLADQPAVAWAPNSRDLAVTTPGQVRRASARGGVWVRLDRRDHPQGLVGWSPSGAVLAYVTSIDDVVLVARDGRKLDDFIGEAALWSPSGRLAVRRDNETWDVYAAGGARLATIAAAQLAWSPSGRLLASVTASGRLEVRLGGVGKPVVTTRPVRNAVDPRFVDEAHLLLRGADGYVIYDLAHRATFEAAAAYRIDPALARDGSAYGEWPWGTLVHSTLSGSTRMVDKVVCQGKNADAFRGLQALPDGSGAVFAGDCSAPNDLFSVQADGGGLTRLTQTATDELDPSLSPDGTRVAFARVDGADCEGCNHQIWTTNLDGTDAHAVALPSSSQNAILQDDEPSFSPDGTRLVFARWDAAITGDTSALYTVSANGGVATPLHRFGDHPAWGPARIAYDGQGKLDLVLPDGSGPQSVSAGDYVPAWSTEGRLAAITWGGSARLSIVLPATKRRIALPGLFGSPLGAPGLAWSPDGSRLAFVAADADGVSDVWTVGVDGTGLTRVTHDLGANGALSWR